MGPALVLAAVHQDEVADQEGEAQHDVNISEIQSRESRTVYCPSRWSIQN